MKRNFVILLLCYIILLCGCGNTNNVPVPQKNTNVSQNNTHLEQINQTEEIIDNTWDYVSANYPHVTLEEIENGNFSNQYVIIPIILETVEYSSAMNWVKCSGWFPRNTSYKYDDITLECDKLKGYSPKDLKVGDSIDICVYVYIDDSFGGDIIAFNVNAHQVSLSEIHETFKEHCIPLDYEHIIQSPKDYRGTDYYISGQIIEIVSIDKNYNYIEFILSPETNNKNYVYITYMYEDNEPDINSFATIYGTFSTLSGSKSKTHKDCPLIVAKFIDFSLIPSTEFSSEEAQISDITSSNSSFNTYENDTQQKTTNNYVLNTSSMKIHLPSCSAVKKIAPKNYSTSDLSISELEAQGYSECGICLN